MVTFRDNPIYEADDQRNSLCVISVKSDRDSGDGHNAPNVHH